MKEDFNRFGLHILFSKEQFKLWWTFAYKKRQAHLNYLSDLVCHIRLIYLFIYLFFQPESWREDNIKWDSSILFIDEKYRTLAWSWKCETTYRLLRIKSTIRITHNLQGGHRLLSLNYIIWTDTFPKKQENAPRLFVKPYI